MKYERELLLQHSNYTTFIKDNLEKVLRLTAILEKINTDDFYKDLLVLKGGTAINLCYFDLPRLSVDIVLDLTIDAEKNKLEDIKKNLKEKLCAYMKEEGYTLSNVSKEHYILLSFVFSYVNNAGNKDNIKIEINLIDRVHLLPYEDRVVNCMKIVPNFNVRTLNLYELFASKMNALITRGTPRDLYDTLNIIEKYPTLDLQLLKKCLIFYNMVGGRQNIKDLDFTMLESLNYYLFKKHLKPLLKKSDKFNIEEAKKKVIEFVRNLLVFDDSEVEFIELFKQRIYKPELLFNDETILENIKNHPMALWRCNGSF